METTETTAVLDQPTAGPADTAEDTKEIKILVKLTVRAVDGDLTAPRERVEADLIGAIADVVSFDVDPDPSNPTAELVEYEVTETKVSEVDLDA